MLSGACLAGIRFLVFHMLYCWPQGLPGNACSPPLENFNCQPLFVSHALRQLASTA
jgi:hypothetical protein